jgi:hypothetical protein
MTPPSPDVGPIVEALVRHGIDGFGIDAKFHDDGREFFSQHADRIHVRPCGGIAGCCIDAANMTMRRRSRRLAPQVDIAGLMAGAAKPWAELGQAFRGLSAGAQA